MNSDGSEPRLIGVDWGTTSFRAYLLGTGGAILRRIELRRGILHVEEGDFEGFFRTHVGPWLTEYPLPVIVSGMITSRNGWIETPYVELPAGPEELAEKLTAHRLADGLEIYFITGATALDATGAPDVMRGEETEIAGALDTGLTDGLLVMPGTHSKWVKLSTGRIAAFETFMTGEVFAALRDATILGKLMAGTEPAPEAFARGVRAGFASPGALLHRLFHARTLPLMGLLEEWETADFLSGLLIGTEIGAAIAGRDIDCVSIIGRSDLARRYGEALGIAGIGVVETPPDLATRGHLAIARMAGLMEG
ncbi:2-dehydro-3-deoxygalactonokinase [Tropicimonas marinistellae]|uniref:2-dehydro-3-deoxygalactonokinase n=1 Tax=Tropicimonas marinistellae TaxID=1739787 RepID=UPI000831ED4C|nr:2-dehydro-3-deoxygalactonokinase [Tropicimonas marinistellae]